MVCLCCPHNLSADEIVQFKNGRIMHVDTCELEEDIYIITTMSGGVIKVPKMLIESVDAALVDMEVEEVHGTGRSAGGSNSSSSRFSRTPSVPNRGEFTGGSEIEPTPDEKNDQDLDRPPDDPKTPKGAGRGTRPENPGGRKGGLGKR